MRRLLQSARAYRAATTAAHLARVFAASVFCSLLLLHVTEGVRIVAPLALATLAVIVAPAALESPRAPR